jgi:ribosomal protein L31E
MAQERFEDKTLHKKDDAKMKGEPEDEEEKIVQNQATSTEKTAVKPEEKTDAKKTPKEAAKTLQDKEKKEIKKEEKKIPKFVLERKYMVNLTDAYSKPRFKRANKAISLLQAFAERHMKAKNVHVDVALNNTIRKSAAPIKKVHVLFQKDEAGTVFATLAAQP